VLASNFSALVRKVAREPHLGWLTIADNTPTLGCKLGPLGRFKAVSGIQAEVLVGTRVLSP